MVVGETRGKKRTRRGEEENVRERDGRYGGRKEMEENKKRDILIKVLLWG